ncbi:MAG: 7-carboxy-7-deazaguanine synthase QueE [Crocinitomicaceae bacterium]|jgi:7-carboxy-7-deazaguanine synthase|nr:7-carboxy-7-deazaguanine synthase QueE [Crocinitomicaceae bacterium]
MSDELPVMEEFLTIQGEGKYTGTPAYFIRLGGCDVGCVWCDVKESWDAKIHPYCKVSDIINRARQADTDLVVITGGEPAMYDLSKLCDELRSIGKTISIETSGCYPLKGAVNWYTFSPKKFKEPIKEAYEKANELKVVIFHKSDFKWAIDHATKVNIDCLLYIQPEWSKKDQLMNEIVTFVKRNKGWKISLQTHKYMNIP